MSSIPGTQNNPPLTRGARLRRLLDRPPAFVLTLRNFSTSSTDPKTTDEFRKAAKHRREDRDAILEILGAESDETTWRTEDQWIPEFLNIEGNTAEDLADVLVNEVHDGPWILRSDYFETYFRRIDTNLLTVGEDSKSMNTPHHSANCPHQTVRNHERAEDKDIAYDNYREQDSLPPDLFLGLAGFIPIFPAGERDVSLLHEIWIDGMSRHCFLLGYREIAVSYSSTVLSADQDQPSEMPISSEAVFPLWEQILLALRQVVISISELQRLGLFCDSLPIIVMIQNGAQTVAEVVNIDTSTILSLLAVMTKVDKMLKSSIPTSSYFSPGILSLEVVSVLVPPLAWATSAYMARRTQLEAKRNEQRAQLFSLLRPILADLHHSLWKNSFSPFELRGNKSSHIELHAAALIVQVLCLAVQSFLQCHIGMPRLSFLGHDFEQVHLLGALERGSVIAHLQELKCLGAMTRGPILVFEGLSDPDRKSESYRMSKMVKLAVVCSLEDVMYIWGRGGIKYETSGESSGGLNIRNMWIGGGLLHPTGHLVHAGPAKSMHVAGEQEDHNQMEMNEGGKPLDGWHWEARGVLNVSPSRRITWPSTNRHQKICIGSISVHQNCPLSTAKGQEVLRRCVSDYVLPLKTSRPYWSVKSKQVGGQAGQFVTIQGNIEWEQKAGKSMKQTLLGANEHFLIPELGRLWGVRASLCSGLMQRVRLQQLLASHMKRWIKGVSPSAKYWLELETKWGMTEAFESGDLTQWFKGIPDELEPRAWELIAKILSELENTGVDQDNQLRLAWLHVDKSLGCLKIPCTGGNFWARTLTDSWSSTAFVSITPLCLNSSSDFHECKQEVPITYKPPQAFSLCTKVRPQCEDYHSRKLEGEFTLKAGKSYWIGPKDLMLLATASADGERFKLNVRKSKIPGKAIFRRLEKLTVLRETNDYGAVECFVMTEDKSFGQGPKENWRTTSDKMVDKDKEEINTNEDPSEKKEVSVAFSEITEDAASLEIPIRTASTASRRA